MRWESAKDALARLDTAADYPAMIKAWVEFLIACGGIYTKLEQGAKGCPKSTYWFGTKKHERRVDPLLVYLHQARNADEHGIEPVTKPFSYIVFGGPTPLAGVETTTGPDGEEIVTPIWQGGQQPGHYTEASGSFAQLATVRDARYGDEFKPPIEHLGEPLTNTWPYGVGSVGLAYFDSLITEAGTLPILA